MKILMIEDDKTTIEVIRLTLEVQDPNSTIISREKGREGLAAAHEEIFDVAILDLGLPDIDGLKVLQELREFSQMPVLVVSARHDPTIITRALELGAQDYILKPFKFQSFLNSLKEVTTLSQTIGKQEMGGRINDDLTIKTYRHEVLLKGHRVELSAAEWTILNTLLEHNGRIVPLKNLAEMLSEGKFVSESAVHMTVSQLRNKLGDDPYIPRLIISDYECGYRFIRPNKSTNSVHTDTPSFKIAL